MTEFGSDGPTTLVTADGAPLDPIVGCEQEEAANYHGATPITNKVNFMGEILTRVLPDGFAQYRETGERTYIDHGHPEYAAPEDISYLGASHRLLIGHLEIGRRLRDFAESGKRAYGVTVDPDQLGLIANTRSAPSELHRYGESWGKHTSMLAPRALLPARYIIALAAYRSSRIVFTGAGTPGLDSRGNYRFELSEKAPFIEDVCNEETTHNRPLVNLRDETLADPSLYRRIHDSAGETVMAPLPDAMDMAASALIIRACGLGVNFDDLCPVDPVAAIKAISADPSLKQTITLMDGRHVTGVNHQQEILARALPAVIRADQLTEQDDHFSQRLLDVLDRLERDPISAARSVNWVIKQQIIEREFKIRRGNSESDFAIAWLRSLAFHSILPEEGMGMKLLRKGWFEASPSAEVLAHGLPLPETRAKVRGKAIAAVRAERLECAINWDHLTRRQVAYLRLADPYDTDETNIEPFLEKLRAAS